MYLVRIVLCTSPIGAVVGSVCIIRVSRYYLAEKIISRKLLQLADCVLKGSLSVNKTAALRAGEESTTDNGREGIYYRDAVKLLV